LKSTNAIRISEGHVNHTRLEGAKNSFRYPSFYILFPVNAADELIGQLKKKFRGVLSFVPRDYLRGSEGALDHSIKSFLLETCAYEAEEVWLQTLPRMFGYAFNPVNFWFCKRAGGLEAVLVEVNNTFGERHFYWIEPKTEISDSQWFEAKKCFHVSPFFPVEGFYRFRFRLSDASSRVDINYHAPDGALRLSTWVEGKLGILEERSVFHILKRYGWMTPVVVLRIHSQALKLWLKKIKFYRKPSPPKKEVTS
jgi:DUF1365 family protein